MRFDPAAAARLEALATPAAVVDEAQMRDNVERMAARMRGLGVAFRPHVKTAKSIEIARLQLAAGARGITVSTLREAQAFFEAGFDDILYAVGIAPSKLPAARALRARGCRLALVADSIEQARAVVAGGAGDEVLVEIDSDGDRAGVEPEDDLLLEVGRTLHEGGAVLRGVMTHAGTSYECATRQALERVAERERAGAVRAAERLRAAGLPCPTVSVGSTPTAWAARHLEGVTEVRAGVYVFHDLVMANIGVASEREIALGVLATVIGHRADRGWTFIDAGWTALSRDRGTATQSHDYGYGQVCALDGTPMAGLTVENTNQEHGMIAGDPTGKRLPLGARVLILPNHACATATQFDRFDVLRTDGTLAAWERIRGW